MCIIAKETQMALKKKIQSKNQTKNKKIQTKKTVIKKAVTKKFETKKIIKKRVIMKKTEKPLHKAAMGPTDIKPYKAKKDEEYMGPEQLNHFRNILLLWKDQLQKEMDRTMQYMQEAGVNFPDPIDRASQEEGFNLELRTRDRERKLLRKIEETLAKMKDNDYGFCEVCGAEIGLNRLQARPTATQCIDCKTVAEMREKQIGEPSEE